MTSGAVLLFSGALDHSPRVNIDPASESTAASNSVPQLQPRPQDEVMIGYLSAVKTWNDCRKTQPADANGDIASSACGTMPEQPDDPQLNTYLAAVLDWNKCAAPRLKHGGLDQAVIACGAQPVSPLGN